MPEPAGPLPPVEQITMIGYLNARVGRKLTVGFALCLGLALLVGAVAIRGLGEMRGRMEGMASHALSGAVDIGRTSVLMRQFRLFEYRHITSKSSSEKTKVEEDMQLSSVKVAAALKAYEALAREGEDSENLKRVRALWEQFLTMHAEVIAASRSGDTKKALALMNGPTKALFRDQLEPTTQGMFDWHVKNGQRDYTASVQTFETGRITITLLLSLMFLVGAIGCWLLARHVTRMLAQVSGHLESLHRCLAGLRQAMEAMAGGDLTQSVPVTVEALQIRTGDEFGAMAVSVNAIITETQSTVDSFHHAQGNLRGLISQFAENAAAVASTSANLSASIEQNSRAAREITTSIHEVLQSAAQSAQVSAEMAHGSDQQSEAAVRAAGATETLQQAAGRVAAGGKRQQQAVEQAGEGMNQAAGAVEAVAQSSQQMAANARQAVQVAKDGSAAVEQTIGSMQQIKDQVNASAVTIKRLGDQGQKIGLIVETIDQISEQTNLLALNAAIEAARAGQHGTGFAVVADEVRKLAVRAANATKEIDGLISQVQRDVAEAVSAIETSSNNVGEASRRSEQAGRSLHQILDAASSVVAQAEDVTSSAARMTQYVQVVSDAVEAVRNVARENEQVVTQMGQGVEQVSSVIATVAAISQQTAAGSQEMSASARQVAAAAQSVTGSIERQNASVLSVEAATTELNTMAGRLQEVVRQFRIQEQDDTSAPGRSLARAA